MKFALAGNPNCGKTTLFNNLTGSTAHVGNWPGVTIDRREGIYNGLAEPVSIIDLPGIYSLSPYTPEEVISRNYIIYEHPDVVINIIDATNLERNLYLTTQILEIDIPVIIAVNMSDILKKSGDKIDIEALEKELGVPVVTISALYSTNIKDLMNKAYESAKNYEEKETKRKGKSVVDESYLAPYVSRIKEILSVNNIGGSLAFNAVKVLENDSVEIANIGTENIKDITNIRNEIVLPEFFDGDFEVAIADIRYKYIENNYIKTLTRSKTKGKVSTSDKVDTILTSRYFGLPIFFLLMFAIFHITFGSNLFFVTGIETPGVMLQTLTGSAMGVIIENISNLLTNLGVSAFVHGLVVDGLLAGFDAVLSFIPQILLLFLFLSIIEDTGYMARAAFMMDNLFRRFGLSGKAFIPMLMGFGCSVPAIMATRTMEKERDKRFAIMLMTGFSCGAKLPIWSMFALAFFPDHADLMVFGIYILGIVTTMICAFMLKNSLFKGDSSTFILELPAYRLPQAKSLMIHLWEKLKGYLVRAGTIIAASAIVIWLLANFNFSLQMVESNSVDSILGTLGTFLVPLFRPLGFASGPDGWKAIVAILTGLIAKEVVVSTMGVLYNPGVEANPLENGEALNAMFPVLLASFSIPSAISFMAFNLLTVPCMAAVAATSSEMHSKKWLYGTIAYWLILSYTVSFIVYNGLVLLGV